MRKHRSRFTRAPLLPLSIAAVAAAFVLSACDRDHDQDEMQSKASPPAATTAVAARTATDTGSTDWKAVDQAIGRTGKAQPGGVYKYSFPRSDLHVRVDDVTLKPALALGGWVAFKGSGASTIAMGDLVLTEREVSPVITQLQATGIEQTALHNHLQGESPRVRYLHIRGVGDPVKLARAIHDALALTKLPPPSPPPPASSMPLGIDTAQIARALGHGGSVTGGVYQVSVARAESIRMDGMDVPPSMGVATAINFQPTGGGRAAITGDFVLIAGEVNPVIRALRANGIAVTALHMHMLTEEPRLFFMHFWASDDAVKLATGLRAALAEMNVKP